MRQFPRLSLAVIAAGLVGGLSPTRALAKDAPDKARGSVPESRRDGATASPSQGATEQDPPELNLLDARRQGVVSVKAEGRGGGRMTVSVTNRTNRPLRVVLPPGIVARGATGEMGGMGGMMGGGMRSV